MIIRHNFNRQEKRFRGRKIEGFSVTIPEQAMSIREIYERFNHGIPLDLAEQRGLFDKLSLDDFDVTDITDVQSVADLYNRMSDVQKRAHLEKWLDPKDPPIKPIVPPEDPSIKPIVPPEDPSIESIVLPNNPVI